MSEANARRCSRSRAPSGYRVLQWKTTLHLDFTLRSVSEPRANDNHFGEPTFLYPFTTEAHERSKDPIRLVRIGESDGWLTAAPRQEKR